MKNQRTVFEGWTVLDKDGRIQRYEFGYGLQEVVVATKKEAYEKARLMAERADELRSGDINRWEGFSMPHRDVRRMGFRVVKARVLVRGATR